MIDLNNRTKGIIALVLVTALFASMGIFARYLNTGFLLLQQVYLRLAAAFFFSLLLFYKDLHFNKLKKISPKEWGLLIFRSISVYVLGVTLISYAVINTKYGNTALIGSLPLSALFGFVLYISENGFRI